MDEVVILDSDDEEIARPGPGGWACKACTLQNPPAFLACTLCGTERGATTPAAAAPQPPPQPAAAGQELQQVRVQQVQQPGGAAGPSGSGRGSAGWSCEACTFRNPAGAAACEVCGSAGPGAAAIPPAPATQAPAPAAPAAGRAREQEALPELAGAFALDCSCRLAAAEAQAHLAVAAAALPSDLQAAVGHLRCPRAGCGQAVTRRDLQALLGEARACKVDAALWAAAASAAVALGPAAAGAAAAADGGGGDGGAGSHSEVIDLLLESQAEEAPAALPAPAAAAAAAGGGEPLWRQCAGLAGLLLQLHGVLVSGTLPAQDSEGGVAPKGGARRGARRRSGGGGGQQQQQQQQQQQGGSGQQQPQGGGSAGGGRRRGRATQPGVQPQGPKWQPQLPPWAAGGAYGGGDGEDEGDWDNEEEEYGEGWDEEDMVGGAWGWGGGWGGRWGGGGRGRGRGNGQRQPQAKGVGYGGGGGGNGKRARDQQAAAAEREGRLDAAAAGLIADLRQHLQACSAAAAQRLAPLPLALQGVLRGGPAPPLLRLLLHNDSLMDVSARRQLYTGVFALVGTLAESPDLLPLLLQPADSDLLKSGGPPPAPATAQQQQQPGSGGGASGGDGARPAKRPSSGAGSVRRSPAQARSAGGSGAAGAGSGPAAPEPAAAEEMPQAPAAPSVDSSCWDALQGLRMQADVFRRNAERLAAEGDEEDVALAVELWRASMRQPAPAPPALPAPPQQEQAAAGGGGGRAEAAAVATPEQRQAYEQALKPLLFQSCPLLADHYFRQQAGGAAGAVSDRLRRVTKEVASLPGQLPVGWDSSVLVALDEDRLDVLRAVIFAPPGTPYAGGAFAFDVLLPPDYPSSPPLVQFLTTGGGRVRFNPNLYENGKVCLSLLGTWAGPGWQAGQSTLLQVLISIQSMILGTDAPYFNEPGYARMEGTPQGRQQSHRYNLELRRHTLQTAILGQLQRPPAGFEQAVWLHFRHKAGEIKAQARRWAREDGSSKQLAAQVVAALDALCAEAQ